jgi:hypothetical protein
MGMSKVSFAIVLLFTLPVARLALGENAPSGNAAKASSPILVELFTSEGCSSCPPADALLQQIDASQPVSGAQIIVLSEHVDYWDHDGWKDPYSLHSLTDRQDSYAHALKLASAYTPQLIMDGSTELRGDSQQLSRAFQEALTTPKIPVHISSVSFEAAPAPTIHAHVEADGISAKHSAEVYVALAIDHAESQVLRGENSGRHLKHVAVVQSLTKIGKLEKGKSFDRDVALKLGIGMDPSNIRVVAFVQESGPGKVLAGAMWKSAN